MNDQGWRTKMEHPLHILQGAPAHLNTLWTAGHHDKSTRWIVPKSAAIGDEVFIYCGEAFVAAARVASKPTKAKGWINRYAADIDEICELPRITIHELRAKIPDWKWTRYPRGMAILSGKRAAQVRNVVDAGIDEHCLTPDRQYGWPSKYEATQ